ncbi:hypothetical protein PRCB_12795 [Pantoea rodasii]|uniref:Uncharacterized protein n=1 Tax=Pantoea rodasii TaxID=1076549 RepID=A0A2M9WCG2_9GAMM|nr:hypothetical protein PRCB_12795 [Pantoea rodasii]
MRRNLAERRQRKKAIAYAIALFRTFYRRNNGINPLRLTTSRLFPRHIAPASNPFPCSTLA